MASVADTVLNHHLLIDNHQRLDMPLAVAELLKGLFLNPGFAFLLSGSVEGM